MSWVSCEVNRISCALTTRCIYTIYFVMASTYFEKMQKIGRILRYSSVVSFCKDLMLSENKESSSMRTDEDSFLHYSELVGLLRSIKLQSDHDARIFRVQEDPFRATSCTLKESSLHAGRKSPGPLNRDTGCTQ